MNFVAVQLVSRPVQIKKGLLYIPICSKVQSTEMKKTVDVSSLMATVRLREHFVFENKANDFNFLIEDSL